MARNNIRNRPSAERPARPGGPGRGRSRGAPLRQPVALAVATDATDFDHLRAHGLFGEADYSYYLRRTDSQLRALRGQGLDVHLRVLEPADFEDFCEEHLLDPRDPVARVAYAADPELAGEPFLYAGERLAELIPALRADHLARVRISIGCAALLEAIGRDEQPESRLAAVLQYVSEVYLGLAEGAGDGCHLLTLRSVGLGEEDELAAAGDLCVTSGEPAGGGRGVEAFCVTLAAAVAGCGSGELLLHTDGGGEGARESGRDGEGRAVRGDGRREVRGWALVDGWLRPMSALETLAVLAAVPAADRQENVAARPGFPLPFRAEAPPETGGAGEAGH